MKTTVPAKTKTPAAAAVKAEPLPSLPIPEGGCRVRMYRQGLGDCWLLSFGAEGGPCHVLVDCGVHAVQSGGRKRIRQIAQDILEVTGGRIHVLVATHEHADHLSGFVDAWDIFQKIQIDELWLAWTEDREDPVANRLRLQRGHTLAAIRAALKKLQKSKESAGAERIRRLAGFSSIDEMLGAAGAGATLSPDAASVSRQEMALQQLTDHAREVSYLRPGKKPVPLPNCKARAFVLGPPLDEKLLRQSDPSTGATKEVYLSGPGLNEASSFTAAALNAAADTALDQDTREILNLSFPFDESHRIPEANAAKHPALNEVVQAYRKSGRGWRQIDNAWLEAAGSLALHLEADTNNTSLALAFELHSGGPLMLFPGDAQVGSWRSWHDLKWRGDDGMSFGVEDILARTALYKVSHHASHNGTLKVQGLEMMGDDLIAMIPVDHAAAAKLRGWNMPFPPLYERLLAKTGGRLLRSDQPCPLLVKKARKPSALTREQWTRFRKTVETELYYDLAIEG
jgi:hypothetical protein